MRPIAPDKDLLRAELELRDGHVLVTLHDAANLFGSFSEAIVAHGWVSHAIKLLIEAAEDGSRPAIG